MVLMLGISMIVLGTAETDPFEADISYVLGAVGIAVWLTLVVAAGRTLNKGSPESGG